MYSGIAKGRCQFQKCDPGLEVRYFGFNFQSYRFNGVPLRGTIAKATRPAQVTTPRRTAARTCAVDMSACLPWPLEFLVVRAVQLLFYFHVATLICWQPDMSVTAGHELVHRRVLHWIAQSSISGDESSYIIINSMVFLLLSHIFECSSLLHTLSTQSKLRGAIWSKIRQSLRYIEGVQARLWPRGQWVRRHQFLHRVRFQSGEWGDTLFGCEKGYLCRRQVHCCSERFMKSVFTARLQFAQVQRRQMSVPTMQWRTGSWQRHGLRDVYSENSNNYHNSWLPIQLCWTSYVRCDDASTWKDVCTTWD